MEKKNPSHRPLKYGEETVVLNFRVPKSKVEAVRKAVETLLKKWIKKK